MILDRLEAAYWSLQNERVRSIFERVTRDSILNLGRVIPQDGDLTQGTGRRLDLSVLFIDIVSSSKRPSETLDEQLAVLKTYDIFFTEMIRIAEEYGGTVEKNTGDGLMVYFPDNCGGSISKSGHTALACALTIFYTLQGCVNPLLASHCLAPISIRAGLDQGSVTIAQIGAARRFGSRVAIGTTANVACKMLEGTGEGIFIGENITRHSPAEWHQWCIIKNAETGYLYAQGRAPYRYFEFIGRWTRPL